MHKRISHKRISHKRTFILLCSTGLLNACASHETGASFESQKFVAAHQQQTAAAPQTPPVQTTPTQTLNGMVMPLGAPMPNIPANTSVSAITSEKALNTANKKALIAPKDASFANSTVVYPYTDGALFLVYTAPQKLTDIELQPGETIVSIAAGDSVRWIIGKTYSGSGNQILWHILVKPTADNLNTTLVVMTNKRTYRMQLTSTTTTYTASVRWDYAQNSLGSGELNTTPTPPPAPTQPTDYAMNLNEMNTHYAVELKQGTEPDWYPKAVFSDGVHTFIELPNNLSSSLPILLVSANAGSGEQSFKDPSYSSMVNYRIKGHYIIADTVIKSAILQSGVDSDEDKSDQKTVVWIHQS